MSTLILILIFITLKKNTKSAPILKNTTESENYSTSKSPDSKSSNKINDSRTNHHHYHHHHHDRPFLKKSHFRRNLTSHISTHNPILDNFVMQSRNSRFSEGKESEIMDSPFKSEEPELTKYAMGDRIGREFLNDLLILLFIGTICLTLVVMSSWVFYKQARKFRKGNPENENIGPETFMEGSENITPNSEKVMKASEKSMKNSDAYSKISKLLKKSNSNHDQSMLEELVDILRKNVEIPSLREEIDDTANKDNKDESLSKKDLEKIERLTTVSCTSQEDEKCNSSSIPDLPQYLIERTKEPTVSIPIQEVVEKEEKVYPTEQQQLVYHAVMENYRNDVVTPTLHFLGQDVSTSTEDLENLENGEDIPKSLANFKTEKLSELGPIKEDLEKTYFLSNKPKHNDSRISVSVQTIDPNDNSFVRNVKFSGEVMVKYYLVNQPIHAFDRRRKRHKMFEIREIVESYPTKRKDGLGKCKNLKRLAKSRDSKPSLRNVNQLCTCCQKD